ncbi:MAG: Flp pilus assembly complex ATPase component TadA [Magnetococcales bacterium]|nr:Flp pilus assembly complex ATPase component TadA [Magnetococcales bacterium]
MPSQTKTNLIGDLLVSSRVITSDQRDKGLLYKDETGVRLGEGLICLGYLDSEQLQEFLQRQNKLKRIGELLVAAGLITPEQLQKALEEQKETGAKLGQSLDRLGFLPEGQFLTFLANKLKLPFVDLTKQTIDPITVQRLPEAMARRFRAVILSFAPNEILMGMIDPTDLFAYDQLVKFLKTPIKTALVSQRSILRIFDLYYRQIDEIDIQAARLEEEVVEYNAGNDSDNLDESAVDAPVVRIIESLFSDAVRLNASDIHIEPDSNVIRIRMRVDGVLTEQIIKEQRIAPALVSKLKLMAGIEIAKKRLPQDGRFQITVQERKIDVRLSTLPIQDGESVVLRLLDQSGDNLKLEMVGMEPDILKRFKHQISRPQGLVLVTGPTGSGKTTTIYGALNVLNQPQSKIITVEEPVEYRLPRINQVQVHNKIGLTYAEILRTVLRQDPDIVLVGEMRDQEISRIAIRAALTGHLVFSSLHTISAVSTTIRLIEMGLEGYAVAAALRCILAQRLVRRVCKYCARPRAATFDEAKLCFSYLGDKASGINLQEGSGCSHCNNSGFLGRIAVVELLEMNGELADALRKEDLAHFVVLANRIEGFVPLHIVALKHAVNGVISLTDAMRLVSDAQEDPVNTKNQLLDDS